jgi:replicative DNA helicase
MTREANGRNGRSRRREDDVPASRIRQEEIAETAALFDTMPPCDINAERGLLGSIVLMIECLDELAFLREDDFFDLSHQIIFAQLRNMHARNRQFDIILLVERLRAQEQLDQVGGVAYISKLVHFVPNAAHYRYYADIVREKATLRRVITSCTEVLQEAYSAASRPATEIIGHVETEMSRINDLGMAGTEIRPFNEVVIECLDQLEARANSETPRILDVGLDALRDCSGLAPGGLTIIGGRTSMGKSAACITIARNAARAGKRVYFAAMEMSANDITDRILSAESEIACNAIARARGLSIEQRHRIIDVAGQCREWPMHIDDRPGLSLMQIQAAVRKIIRRHQQLDLIVIDYLQIVYPDNARDERLEQLAKLTRGMKRMARELKIPVVCAAQVNRGAEDNSDKRPRLSQLRGSGDIEQDADAVVFVHRPSYYNPPANVIYGEPEQAEMILAKNRNGPTGVIDVLWYREIMSWENKAAARFEELSGEAQPTANQFT